MSVALALAEAEVAEMRDDDELDVTVGAGKASEMVGEERLQNACASPSAVDSSSAHWSETHWTRAAGKIELEFKRKHM